MFSAYLRTVGLPIASRISADNLNVENQLLERCINI